MPLSWNLKGSFNLLRPSQIFTERYWLSWLNQPSEMDLWVDLTGDVAVDYLQMNIILLVHPQVSVIHEVHRIDLSTEGLRRVERYRHCASRTKLPYSLHGKQLTRVYLTKDYPPTSIFDFWKMRRMGLRITPLTLKKEEGYRVIPKG